MVNKALGRSAPCFTPEELDFQAEAGNLQFASYAYSASEDHQDTADDSDEWTDENNWEEIGAAGLRMRRQERSIDPTILGLGTADNDGGFIHAAHDMDGDTLMESMNDSTGEDTAVETPVAATTPDNNVQGLDVVDSVDDEEASSEVAEKRVMNGQFKKPGENTQFWKHNDLTMKNSVANRTSKVKAALLLLDIADEIGYMPQPEPQPFKTTTKPLKTLTPEEKEELYGPEGPTWYTMKKVINAKGWEIEKRVHTNEEEARRKKIARACAKARYAAAGKVVGHGGVYDRLDDKPNTTTSLLERIVGHSPYMPKSTFWSGEYPTIKDELDVAIIGIARHSERRVAETIANTHAGNEVVIRKFVRDFLPRYRVSASESIVWHGRQASIPLPWAMTNNMGGAVNLPLNAIRNFSDDVNFCQFFCNLPDGTTVIIIIRGIDGASIDPGSWLWLCHRFPNLRIGIVFTVTEAFVRYRLPADQTYFLSAPVHDGRFYGYIALQALANQINGNGVDPMAGWLLNEWALGVQYRHVLGLARNNRARNYRYGNIYFADQKGVGTEGESYMTEGL
ncbi:hypothetical protein IFR05_010389 [Cadophora sp. M221]|nr:hypothetical protein IFR05_010389 [Cadophora sp. M221]